MASNTTVDSARWLSVAAAADLLSESATGLRKKLERAARRGPAGAVVADLGAGVSARKPGKLWKIRLSPEWMR